MCFDWLIDWWRANVRPIAAYRRTQRSSLLFRLRVGSHLALTDFGPEEPRWTLVYGWRHRWQHYKYRRGYYYYYYYLSVTTAPQRQQLWRYVNEPYLSWRQTGSKIPEYWRLVLHQRRQPQQPCPLPEFGPFAVDLDRLSSLELHRKPPTLSEMRTAAADQQDSLPPFCQPTPAYRTEFTITRCPTQPRPISS